ncbi:MAG: SDR family oxidoreductase [Pseudomonadota bacterium]
MTFEPATRNTSTTALIAGGSQGLGFAVAEQLAAEGCTRIVIGARGEEKGEKATAGLRERGVDAIFIRMDLADAKSCKAFIAKGIAHFGSVDALVNAGADTRRGTILNTTPEFFDHIQAVNVRGPFFTMQAFIQHCIDAGHSGRIVNILSTEHHCGHTNLAPYAATKAALANITKNAANAHLRHRININAVAPGWMDTPNEDKVQREIEGKGDNWLEEAEAEAPFGQLIKPAEIAGLISYLLSPQVGVMTGAVIDHDQHVIGSFPED